MRPNFIALTLDHERERVAASEASHYDAAVKSDEGDQNMADALKVGDAAPNFELMDETKTVVKLADLKGKKVVLLFYPMDFSPVCTTEHCEFGPGLGKITGGPDTVVYGVSCDSPFSHAAFKKQYGIPYSLLADPTRKMAKAYGMWAGEEPYNCTKRGTVVIGKDGKVAYYQEVAMREPRKLDDLASVVAKA
jgi:peroxiredoxin